MSPAAALALPALAGFDAITLEELDEARPEALDALPYGVIGFGEDGAVEVYNAAESRYAGLRAGSVLGRHFFAAVAPCMNNRLVAERFASEPRLDCVIDYMLTLRMRPTPVKLRLLQGGGARAYVLVQR